MSENTTPTSPQAGIARRHLIGAAAWSAPVLALAVAAPAHAASQVTITPHSGSHIQMGYGRIEIDGVLRDNVPTFTYDPSSNIPVIGFSSDTSGLTAHVTSYSVTLTFPTTLTWVVSDPNYTMSAPVDNGDGTFTYTLGLASIPTTAFQVQSPLGMFPASPQTPANSFPPPHFVGHAIGFVPTAATPWAVQTAKTYTYVAHLPAGDEPGTFYRTGSFGV